MRVRRIKGTFFPGAEKVRCTRPHSRRRAPRGSSPPLPHARASVPRASPTGFRPRVFPDAEPSTSARESTATCTPRWRAALSASFVTTASALMQLWTPLAATARTAAEISAGARASTAETRTELPCPRRGSTTSSASRASARLRRRKDEPEPDATARRNARMSPRPPPRVPRAAESQRVCARAAGAVGPNVRIDVDFDAPRSRFFTTRGDGPFVVVDRARKPRGASGRPRPTTATSPSRRGDASLVPRRRRRGGLKKSRAAATARGVARDRFRERFDRDQRARHQGSRRRARDTARRWAVRVPELDVVGVDARVDVVPLRLGAIPGSPS